LTSREPVTVPSSISDDIVANPAFSSTVGVRT
jgi:hypothetical protein